MKQKGGKTMLKKKNECISVICETIASGLTYAHLKFQKERRGMRE